MATDVFVYLVENRLQLVARSLLFRFSKISSSPNELCLKIGAETGLLSEEKL